MTCGIAGILGTLPVQFSTLTEGLKSSAPSETNFQEIFQRKGVETTSVLSASYVFSFTHGFIILYASDELLVRSAIKSSKIWFSCHVCHSFCKTCVKRWCLVCKSDLPSNVVLVLEWFGGCLWSAC